MPEFQIDLGDMAETYQALDEFTQGYIEAAFFTEGCDGLVCDGKSVSDLAPETLRRFVLDCRGFQAVASVQLAQASEVDGYNMRRAGTDFWFTRNHHGAGYWDRDLGQVGDDLTALAHNEGSEDLYLGDDGLIYC